METLVNIGQKHLFILSRDDDKQTLFIGGNMTFNYVLLSIGILSCVFATYIFKTERLSFFFTIMLIFGLVFITSFIKSRSNIYKLILDYDNHQVKIIPSRENHTPISEVIDFSHFDALRIESNIASPNFSVTKTVLISLLHDNKPICFLSTGLFGFSSVENAAQFADHLSQKTGWKIRS